MLLNMDSAQRSKRESAADIKLESLINERGVARISGLSVATIRRRRLLGQPPAWVKLGGRILYRPSDVMTWIEDSRVYPTTKKCAETRKADETGV
jgi:predicted DNA-binding transcriptional regulator AlpA